MVTKHLVKSTLVFKSTLLCNPIEGQFTMVFVFKALLNVSYPEVVDKTQKITRAKVVDHLTEVFGVGVYHLRHFL